MREVAMAILDVLRYPDDRLRTIAVPVTEINDEIRELAKNMFETMYVEEGVGLAATQVNRHIQLLVMDIGVGTPTPEPLVFINPEIIEKDGQQVYKEACLSVPGISENIKRAEHVIVKALNENGEEFIWEARELHAVCIQHEMDHLRGKLFVDYLSPLKRRRFEKMLRKQQLEDTD